MSHRRKSLLLVPVFALAGTFALGACSSQPPVEPAPAPTVTATETPTPPRDASDALTALDAWLACSAVAQHDYESVQQEADIEWLPFDPQWVTDNGDGTFDVGVPAQAAGADHGIVGECTIGGTVASPDVVSFGFMDLG